MSKTAALYFWFCDAANNLTNIQGPFFNNFAIWSENGQDFKPIWDSMSSNNVFYSDVNTQWGTYAADYLKTSECSSMCQKTYDTDFYTPTFPVYHTVEAFPTSTLSYIIITGKPTIETGDYYFSGSRGTLNQHGYTTGEGLSMYRVTSGNSTYIGTNIDLPIGYAASANTNFVRACNISSTLIQGLRINTDTPNKNNARYNRISDSTVRSAINAFIENSPYTPPPTDPYSGAGDSTTGGGDGTFDGTSDPVPVPTLPTVGAQDSGFITLFAPTVQQLKNLAYYMWVNPLFDVTTGFKKLFSDPMDCILGLSVVPVTIPTSGAQNVTVGNLVTSVQMNVASQQYIEVDCGTVDFSRRFFGSYLDYEPYTKMALFLPYCGTHQLNTDDVMGKTVGVVYHIDILTGSCIAFVKCGDSVMYEFNGACGSNIPVNSLNFASTIENAIRIAVNIGTTVATSGAAAPATTAAEAARSQATNVARGISLAGSTAEGALSLKPSVSRSGALGGGVGILGHQTPYFIITRPRLCKPKNQDFFEGYPSFIQTTIGNLVGKGFTSFTHVIIASQYLTDAEESELEEILTGGVYL